MSPQSIPETPLVQQLHERCLAEGVHADAVDLAGVAAFLGTILPALERIEASLGNDDVVACPLLPAPEAR